ncbi:MAG: hypothetical protein JW864_08820 [Spirochaetes bacterium]|nr:hypothetical protein [Spirochaetota bacterium]
MPAIDMRLYKELIENLNRMAEGIANHHENEDFPLAVNEQIIQSAINRINSLKEAYEDSEERTRKFYHLYLQEIKNTRREIASLKLILYEYYGKRNQVVRDFGLKVYK